MRTVRVVLGALLAVGSVGVVSAGPAAAAPTTSSLTVRSEDDQPLTGGCYQVFPGTIGGVQGEAVADFCLVDVDGQVDLSLPDAGRYVLHETRPPDLYSNTGTLEPFFVPEPDVEFDGGQPVALRYALGGLVEVRRADPSTGQPLSRGCVEVRDLRQATAPMYPYPEAPAYVGGCDGLDGALDGVVRFVLPIGSFGVVDTIPPSGRQLDTAVEISPVALRSTHAVVLQNPVRPTVDHTVHVVDAVTGAAVAQGACASIYDGDATFRTRCQDAEGDIAFTSIPEGTYELSFDRRLDGYRYHDDVSISVSDAVTETTIGLEPLPVLVVHLRHVATGGPIRGVCLDLFEVEEDDGEGSGGTDYDRVDVACDGDDGEEDGEVHFAILGGPLRVALADTDPEHDPWFVDVPEGALDAELRLDGAPNRAPVLEGPANVLVDPASLLGRLPAGTFAIIEPDAAADDELRLTLFGDGVTFVLPPTAPPDAGYPSNDDASFAAFQGPVDALVAFLEATTVRLAPGRDGGTWYVTVSDLGNRGPGGARSGDLALQVEPGSTPAPTVTGAPDRPANAAGWWNGPVTVTWDAVGAADPPPTTSVGEGDPVVVASDPVCNAVGCAQGTYPVRIDATAPTVAVTGVADGATYAVGAVPTPGCSASDGRSGIAAGSLVVGPADPGAPGTHTVTCTGPTDLAGNTGAPASVTYTVAAPPTTVRLVVDAIPSTRSGAPFAVTVRAVDADGGPVPGFTGSVGLEVVAPAGGQATFDAPVAATAAVDGVAVFSHAALSDAADGYRLRATAAGVEGAESHSFSVAATRLAVTGPAASVVSGSPFSIDVTARDATGAVAENFASSVSLSASAAGGSDFAPAVSGTAVAGLVSFPAVTLLDAADGYVVSASSPALTGASSAPFDVVASGLRVSGPSSVPAGQPFAVSVSAVDAAGEVAEDFSGSVSLGLSVPAGGQSSLAVLPVAAVDGVATFPQVTVLDAADGYAVTAASPGLPGGSSSTFSVTASRLEASGPAGPVVSGAPFAVAVRALDATGAVAENFASSVSLSASAAGGSDFAPAVSGTAVAGLVSFPAVTLLDAADGYVVSASSPGVTGGASAPFDVVASSLSVSGPSGPVPAGAAFGVSVTARDAAGEVAEDFAGTVTLAATAPGGSDFATTPAAAAAGGSATFEGLVLDDPAGGYLVTATAGSLTGTSAAFDVTAPPPPTGSLAVTLTFVGPAGSRNGCLDLVVGAAVSTGACDDADGALDGVVRFSGLAAGTYAVTGRAPAGWFSELPHDVAVVVGVATASTHTFRAGQRLRMNTYDALGRTPGGVCYRATPSFPGFAPVDACSSAGGVVERQVPAGGRYEVVQRTPPVGYAPAGPRTAFVGPLSGDSVSFVNTLVTTGIRVRLQWRGAIPPSGTCVTATSAAATLRRCDLASGTDADGARDLVVVLPLAAGTYTLDPSQFGGSGVLEPALAPVAVPAGQVVEVEVVFRRGGNPVYVAPRLPNGTPISDALCYRFTPTFDGYGGPVDACTSAATFSSGPPPSYRLVTLPAGTWTVSALPSTPGFGSPPSLPRTIAVNNSFNGGSPADTTSATTPLVVTHPITTGLRVALEGRGANARDVCVTATSSASGGAVSVRRCDRTYSSAGDDDGVARQVTIPLPPGTYRLSFTGLLNGLRAPDLGEFVVGEGQLVDVRAVLRVGARSVWVSPQGATGQLLAGACYRFTPTFAGFGGPVDRCTDDGTLVRFPRSFRLDGLVAGEYVVTEVVTPVGYLPPTRLPVTIRVDDAPNLPAWSPLPTDSNSTTALAPLVIRHGRG